ncbi:7780_t:CDS:2, partial [Scutellospora calospora]
VVSLGMEGIRTVFNNLSSYKKNRQLFIHSLSKDLKNYVTSINDMIEEMFDKNDQRENFELDLNVWMLEIFARRMALWFKVTSFYYMLPNIIIDHILFSNEIKKKFIEQDRNFRDENVFDVLTILVNEDIKSKLSNEVNIKSNNENMIRLINEIINIYDELRDVFEDELYLNYKYINSLKYVDACVKELLYLISTIPFSSRTIVRGGVI